MTERVIGWIRPLIKGYHRCQVRGLDLFPPGGALVVSNHSGGLFPMDVPVFATAFYEKFGYDRPVYALSHDVLFTGPIAEFFVRTGFIRTGHDNADEALRFGGVVVVFPGGDYDVYRLTLSENTIDFDGRTGYVRAGRERRGAAGAGRRHRRSGKPVLLVPRHGTSPVVVAGQTDAGEDSAHLGGLSFSPTPRLSR